MDRYAVVGNPVAHSRSPQIHAAFARQTAQALSYEKLFAPLDGFVGVVERFFGEGGLGVNVTVPFKEQAFAWVGERDPFAATAGAVNTILRTPRGFRGCNTDGVGLVRDLRDNIGVTLHDARILILGAGGAARGIVGPLLGCAPRVVDVANRTEAKAIALMDRLEDPRLRARGLAEVAEPYDVVINATAAGLSGDQPHLSPRAVDGALVYDMVYGAAAAAFLTWAKRAGARQSVDGLGMLVEQAAEAFFLWRGVRPQTRPVIAALRASP